jgi:hypothetical protein
LIDANAFWNRLSHVVYDIFTVHEKDGQLTGTASVGYYTETIEEVLKQTKTVDAVEVVRCKDCVHMKKQFNGRFCDVWCLYNGDGDEGFCNYGERKDDGK